MKLRELKNEDLSEIENIVKNTWNFSEYGLGEEDRYKLARCDVLDCLSRSNYAIVSTEDDEVIAFLLGRIKSEGENRNKAALEKEVEKTREDFKNYETGKRINQFFDTYEEVNNSLIKNLEPFDSEVVLLAVDEKRRGSGIGKQLLEEFLKKAKNRGAKNNLIFSDTTCNYGFYPSIGYEALVSRKITVPILNKKVEFFAFKREL